MIPYEIAICIIENNIQKKNQSWEYSSVAWYLPYICKTLGGIFTTEKKGERKINRKSLWHFVDTINYVIK